MISVKGVLRRGNRILVLKKFDSGQYELPGGTLEFGEGIEQAFERELKEELGFTRVKLGKFINVWSMIYNECRVDYHIVKIDFEFFSNENDIILSPEHTEYRWIESEEVEGLDMQAGHKISLKRYFEDIMRAIDREVSRE